MSDIATSARSATLLGRAAARAPWLALFSALALLLTVAPRPQGLHFFDPVIQSLALQQWFAGIAPDPNTLVRVDPADLTHNLQEWLSWWPPSLQLFATPLVASGITLGGALRTIFAGALIAGAVGWAFWIGRFRLPASWTVALALCLPWMRHASENAFRYSAEILSFALAPWFLLLLARVPQWLTLPTRSALPRLALAGLTLGFGYVMKYSLFLFVACALLALAWETRAHWLRGPTRLACRLRLALLGSAVLVVPLFVRLLNASRGSADPISFAGQRALDPLDLAFALANPALALADAQGPLFHALVFPGVLMPVRWQAALANSTTLTWLALPAGLLLVFLLLRFWRNRAAEHQLADRLAVATLALNTLALLVLWQIAEVDRMPRHLAPAAIAVLPLALREGLDAWRRHSLALRLVLLVGGLVFVAGPLVYGFVYVAAKCRSLGPYVAGPTGLHLPTLSRTDVPAAVAAARLHETPDSVWLVEDPEMALELPGRFMLAYGDRDVGREMHRLHHGPWRNPGDLSAARRMRLLLVLERTGSVEGDVAKARPLTAAISGASDWRRHELPGVSAVLWTGELTR